MVALLRPRVGMVDVQRRKAIRWQAMDDEVSCVGAHDADVGGASAGHPVGSVLEIFVGPFDPKQAKFWMALSAPKQEPALPTADFQLKWTGRPEGDRRVKQFSGFGWIADDV